MNCNAWDRKGVAILRVYGKAAQTPDEGRTGTDGEAVLACTRSEQDHQKPRLEQSSDLKGKHEKGCAEVPMLPCQAEKRIDGRRVQASRRHCRPKDKGILIT